MKITALLTAAATVHLCLDAAVTAARAAEGAAVDALYIMVDPNKLVAPSEEIQFQRLREVREGAVEERAEAVHAAFLAWSDAEHDTTPVVQWRSVTGAEETSVLRETADTNLLVVVHNHNLDAYDALHAALWHTGKPVLLVPAAWEPKSATFSHVVVALSDHEIAADAIASAMPWLRAADHVTALRVGHPNDRAMQLCSRLQDAGIDADRRIVEPDSDNIGTQIVEEAHELGADLLVAGAYHHGSLVEWLMGGTTRHMLAAAKLPLWLEHKAL
ncbi:universal stress protein [Ancylobacter mangrovi]|uniref:universal stress protein n=1 Tax=Ancylobacter mangrovi TaxID=2972472 RepID=UPI0021627C88|nr:universal stress protein [Ancylobacter mangrovi]MCS0501923.1 universal stress protein [Ancylobacter mangrovi]